MHQYLLASLVAVVASLQLLKKEEIYNRLASQNDDMCTSDGIFVVKFMCASDVV